MSVLIAVIILCTLSLMAGYWWGQADSEKWHNRRRANLEGTRLLISMPVGKELGSQTLMMVSRLMEQVEREMQEEPPAGREVVDG